jgi:hypothetical protein
VRRRVMKILKIAFIMSMVYAVPSFASEWIDLKNGYYLDRSSIVKNKDDNFEVSLRYTYTNREIKKIYSQNKKDQIADVNKYDFTIESIIINCDQLKIGLYREVYYDTQGSVIIDNKSNTEMSKVIPGSTAEEKLIAVCNYEAKKKKKKPKTL